METYVQKKFTITLEQKEFLETYKRWGFSDQSSIIREALKQFIIDLEKSERKKSMALKAQELLSDYRTDRDLTAFNNLDGEDFL